MKITLCRNDRILKRGGGVAIYVRCDLQYKIVHQSSNEQPDHPEFLFVEIRTGYQKCLVGVVYKPPKAGFLSDIETALLNLVPYYDHAIVMGDFNINLVDQDSSASLQLKSMFQSINMSILPSQPTHHTPTSDTLLDIIATTNPEKVLSNGQQDAPGISGHDIIYIEYSLHCPKRQ